jgi:hypothetical protein
MDEELDIKIVEKEPKKSAREIELEQQLAAIRGGTVNLDDVKEPKELVEINGHNLSDQVPVEDNVSVRVDGRDGPKYNSITVKEVQPKNIEDVIIESSVKEAITGLDDLNLYQEKMQKMKENLKEEDEKMDEYVADIEMTSAEEITEEITEEKVNEVKEVDISSFTKIEGITGKIDLSPVILMASIKDSSGNLVENGIPGFMDRTNFKFYLLNGEPFLVDNFEKEFYEAILQKRI